MNEERITAARIAAALDERMGTLPWRTTERLAQARQAAVAHARARQAATARPGLGAGPVLAMGGDDAEGHRWQRVLLWLLPVLLVAAGLLGIDQWANEQDADESAEVYSAVLTDEVPLDTYADRGFGVFLKNAEP